jgi:F420-dependent methylenetetrahydromethanopterin dehydrogenase
MFYMRQKILPLNVSSCFPKKDVAASVSLVATSLEAFASMLKADASRKQNTRKTLR